MDLWGKAKALGKELKNDLVKGTKKIGDDLNAFLDECDKGGAEDGKTGQAVKSQSTKAKRDSASSPPTIFDSSLSECLLHTAQSAMKNVEGIWDAPLERAVASSSRSNSLFAPGPDNWNVHADWSNNKGTGYTEAVPLMGGSGAQGPAEAGEESAVVQGHSDFRESPRGADEKEDEEEKAEDEDEEKEKEKEEEGDDDDDDDGDERLDLVEMSAASPIAKAPHRAPQDPISHADDESEEDVSTDDSL